ncbi:hypothetical protein LPJ55_004689 [Coemansia sp. RSA 990]|nr:hypothetical protein LPJ68_003272 [Coemansia sp. RSA 1086]KAJ1870407.1 hypothetical protein LPJ55_004689 [Coemansia sp. RSA 990]
MTLADVQINSCFSHDVSSGVLARVQEVVLARFNELNEESQTVQQAHTASITMRDAAQQMAQFTAEEKELNEELLQGANNDEISHLEAQIIKNKEAIDQHNELVKSANEDVDRYTARLTQLSEVMNSLDGRESASYKVTVHGGIVHVIFEGSAMVNNFDDLVIKEIGEEAVDLDVSLDIYEIIQDTVEGYIPAAAPAA